MDTEALRYGKSGGVGAGSRVSQYYRGTVCCQAHSCSLGLPVRYHLRRNVLLVLLAAFSIAVWGHNFRTWSEPPKPHRHIQGSSLQDPASTGLLRQRERPALVPEEELAEAAPPPKPKEGYIPLTFERLAAYDFPLNPDGSVKVKSDGRPYQIPEDIQNLSGENVTLSGFVLPLSMEKDKVAEFILVRNQLLCCYGQQPQLNEWAVVLMEEPVSLEFDVPVTVSGKFLVGEVMEEERVLCLYRLAGLEIVTME